ncbi:glycosyltransferase family 2 protein [Marinobacter confluentis]|uniref:Glycosyltransferase n=1 Tax=Marinobacter confluentis TaxID=1697557 RepID=A0A4Z1BRW4_9GAMM|nr:glycosyltransferase [Marinobacter confluentis]TGN39939.1 glycosyltransferase [Marinobacter confluentis]
MVDPKVSIIISSYNSEKYIGDALLSVADQTLKEIEVIVVDDGSCSNETSIICEKYRDIINAPLLYIYQKNGGPSKARNVGLSRARGEYIAFLDSDDTFLPTKLQMQLKILSDLPKNYACVIGCAEIINSETRNKIISCPDEIDGYLDVEKFVSGYIKIEGTPGYFFRRSSLESVCGFDELLRNNEDFDLLLRIGLKYKIKTHKDIVFKQRCRPDSLSKSDPIQALVGVLAFCDKLENEFSDVSDASIARKKQRAYFSAAMGCIREARLRHYLWLVNMGLNMTGVKGWKGFLVLISSRPFRWLAIKPPGVSQNGA